MESSVKIVFAEAPVSGEVVAVRGEVKPSKFAIKTGERPELRLDFATAQLERGACPTIVNVKSDRAPFSFFLRDVSAEYPVFIPEYGVAVTTADDPRDYAAIAQDVAKLKLKSEFDRYAAEPEESYAKAAVKNLKQTCPVWLGLGRDMRIFRVGHHELNGDWGQIIPAYHSYEQKLPETNDKGHVVNFHVGPGSSCRQDIKRWIEDGCLPILRSTQTEDDVAYHVTAFATLERSALKRENVRGSDWLASFANTGGNMLSGNSPWHKKEIENKSEAEQQQLKDLIEKETHGREEELVCVFRTTAVNNGKVPRYAWFKAPGRPVDGLCSFDSGRAFCVARVDGTPMPDEEMAILIPPGKSVAVDFLVPHQPLPKERAQALLALDFDKQLADCRKYWKSQLETAAKFSIPEKVIDDTIKAGLLHCDLATLGLQDEGPALATIGWYSPIGSESAPIIQYFDSVGWHKLAERSIDFFLERQRPDGFIQNFAGYQLETGPALWTMGEHFRYTRDLAWAKRIMPQMLKACDYLLQWRERNKTQEQRDKGCYGLIDGKVADPEDYFHSFMLNAVSYLGLARAAEMLGDIDPTAAAKLETEVKLYRDDIREAYRLALAKSPVVPIGDGSWAPMPPPWTEYPGALCLYGDGGKWWTHGAFAARDVLIGSMYLPFCEILDASESGAWMMLKANQLTTKENAGLSQPYYSRHDFAHLKRGEVGAFLKTFYNQLSALHDRETYTFWEHYWHASQHKTHEEGWCLMQTRWMLYLEEGDALSLLKGVPREWLEDGKRVAVQGAKSYFGELSFAAVSRPGMIEAEVSCERPPKELRVRLPHPRGLKAKRAEGGDYDPATETVMVKHFSGKATVKLFF